MENAVLVYTVLFLAYSVLEITGALPQEVISAGLSLPSIFKKYYGDEEVDFVMFHIRRTTAAIVIHSALPLMYIAGLQIVYPHFNMFLFWQAEATIVRLTVVALFVFLFGIATAVLFKRLQWSRHPLAKILSKYGHDWRAIGSTVNAEFRQIDKFISRRRKLVVTGSWIVHCGVHSLNAVRQSDVTLHVVKSENHRVESEGGRAQYLIVKVTSTGPNSTSFTVRLHSDEYVQLVDRVSSPIQLARQIVIQQGLNERFLQVFSEQVEINGVCRSQDHTQPLEPCFGCSQKLPEVKLKKMCSPSEVGECRSCDCKPMWCLSCMSKWFASRQDPNRPDTWMSSRATCPLCRKTFCMLDILSIEQQ